MEFPALQSVAERLIAAEAAYEKARYTEPDTRKFNELWAELMRARQAYTDTFTPATVLAVIRHANVG